MRLFLAFFAFSCSSILSYSQTPFTTGNLAVYKVGNGTDTLSSAGFPVSIDEYTVNGMLVASHSLPVVPNGVNRRMIGSGSATSEGQITRSLNKNFLLVTGYDTIPDPVRLSISNSTAANVNRVVGIFSSNGTLDATTALTDAYSANNFRGAVSDDGNNLWMAGTGNPSASAGVRYTTKGAATSTQLSISVTNIRTVNIFNSQLYCSSGSGAFKAVSAVGTGLNNSAGQIITVLPGFPNVSTATNDPYAFSINPQNNIIYLADNRAKVNGGGIQKWLFDGTNWNLAYTLDSGLTTGLRNLIVDWSAVNPVIYAVTGDQIIKNLPGNSIVKIIDLDSTSTFITIATAGINTVFRGIAFTPEPAAAAVYTFNGNGNWNAASNWLNNNIPPNPLTAPASVIIDHTAGGNCVLNINQTISPGAGITVKTGKNLLILGSLTIH